jgi:hypothetical protein
MDCQVRRAGGCGATYLSEPRCNVRPLLAASLGVGTSLPRNAYIASLP